MKNEVVLRKNDVIKIAILALLIIWIICFFMDYTRARRAKLPLFAVCKVEKYEDGQVHACTGLGYKIYKYERLSNSSIEFGPFFIKEKN